MSEIDPGLIPGGVNRDKYAFTPAHARPASWTTTPYKPYTEVRERPELNFTPPPSACEICSSEEDLGQVSRNGQLHPVCAKCERTLELIALEQAADDLIGKRSRREEAARWLDKTE